jgi:hypothetical protein
MSTIFVSKGIWPQLTKAVRNSRQRCVVAVAYFGAGASNLLPLAKGSRLVVDASERSVASGQTCPADLIKLATKGVQIYSVPNLHAKVFVLGRAAYIGSANVSSRSATHLVEALLRTNETSAVHAAREFVQNHCLHELTPTVLRRLAKLYRPPIIPGGNQGKTRQVGIAKRPSLPRLLLAQCGRGDWSVRDLALHKAAIVVATKRRQHPRSFDLDSFGLEGKCVYRRGDVVIQVVDEGGGRQLMMPPGNVLHVRTRRYPKGQVSFVYLELPARRRRNIKSVARALGCTQNELRSDKVIRDSSFAQALLHAWAIGP